MLNGSASCACGTGALARSSITSTALWNKRAFAARHRGQIAAVGGGAAATPRANNATSASRPANTAAKATPTWNGKAQWTGARCALCTKPQYTCPAGVTCEDGHLNAPSVAKPVPPASTAPQTPPAQPSLPDAPPPDDSDVPF